MLASLATELHGVVRRALELLCDLAVDEVGERSDGIATPHAVSGLIGVSGKARGSIVLGCSEATARELTGRMLAQDPATIPEADVTDCIGELSNIVAGNMLPLIDEGRGDLRIALPSVVIGEHRVVWRSDNMPYLLADYSTAIGPLALGISLQRAGQTTDSYKRTRRLRRPRRRFLIVDDSRVMRKLLGNALSQVVGEVDLVEAADGLEALALLRDMLPLPDMAFCDLNMPNLDGLGLLEKLHAEGRLEAMPVAVVTGEAGDERARAAIEAGARACLSKPFTPEQIAAVVKELVDQEPAA